MQNQMQFRMKDGKGSGLMAGLYRVCKCRSLMVSIVVVVYSYTVTAKGPEDTLLGLLGGYICKCRVSWKFRAFSATISA